MKKLLPVVLLLGFLPCAGVLGSPFKVPHSSLSSSRQFVIYCDDLAMRLAVSSFAEQTKAGILELLGLQDHWKVTIVINLERKDVTQPDQPISQVRLYDVEGGSTKVELDVALGGDLSGARFQQQLVRAILLAMEYRDKPSVSSRAYIDPPSWMVEAMTTYLRNRNANTGSDVDVYKALLEKNHLPGVADFLSQNPSDMNAASLKLYQAYALSFLQLLIGLPNGKACLVSYIGDLPLGTDAPSVDLIKHFPTLNGSGETLGKWWTLSLANISASDRYKGLTQEETEKRLAVLLKFTIPTKKAGETKIFSIEDYKDFIKLPQAKAVLANVASSLQALSAQSAPLYRPITSEYHDIAMELQHGKTRHIDVRLKNVAKYREMISTRTEQVEDYLNWFEATQMTTRSNSFEDYMKTADELSKDAPKRDDLISKYLDGIELQLQ
ncbi:MAG: hypothetical protein WCD79_20210 [Chthoniobacteraceae bacterium]